MNAYEHDLTIRTNIALDIFINLLKAANINSTTGLHLTTSSIYSHSFELADRFLRDDLNDRES